MDLTRYNELLRKMMEGDSSVLPELAELQPKVLAWKQAQRRKAEAKKVEAKKVEAKKVEEKKAKQKVEVKPEPKQSEPEAQKQE